MTLNSQLRDASFAYLGVSGVRVGSCGFLSVCVVSVCSRQREEERYMRGGGG